MTRRRPRIMPSDIKRQTRGFAESPFVIFENLRTRQMSHHFLIRRSGCHAPSTGVADQAASFWACHWRQLFFDTRLSTGIAALASGALSLLVTLLLSIKLAAVIIQGARNLSYVGSPRRAACD